MRLPGRLPAARLSRRLLQGLVALALLASLLAEARAGLGSLREALALVGSDPLEARRRAYGSGYVDAVERMREAIPEDGEYLLLDGSPTGEDSHWPRYDLAPRRARLVGVEREGLWLVDVRRLPGGRALPVVLCEPGRVPELLTAERAQARLPLVLVTKEDDSIPAALDVPADGDALAGERLTVMGWCQERGGRPCEVLHLFVDGRRVAPEALARFPRPDVAAAVPDIGPCEKAGYIFGLRAPRPAGQHQVKVLAVVSGGRYKWLGPHLVTRKAP